MSWIERIKATLPHPQGEHSEGVWIRVIAAVRFYTALSWNVILRSVRGDYHMRMTARNRPHSLLDEGSPELGSELEPKDAEVS